MCREHICLAITTATTRALGGPVNPHMFRDSLATSVAVEDPEHVQIAATMLGHATLATTNAYYNQANMLSAGVDV